ncbi:MAG: hypothetical protein KA118_18465 [Verrucomicrobia bacterium]|nr:hypothetical protein [Verrucomicrobiota bacterium]
MKNIMKDIALGFLLVGAGWSAGAQEQHSWNPYVNQGIVSPAPLLPVEFNGTGVLSFNVGNTGSDPLPLVLAQEMTLVITLSDGVPDNADPLAALGGTWKDMFNWSYDPAHNTYTGIQNQDIPGSSLGTITIQYKVTNNTPITVSSNGFNVNLQPPSYSNGFNVTDDDQVSSYTYVRARDFGDAPSSYGFAVHDINVFRDPDPESDLYNLYINYMYMGVSVDPETANQPSDMADGDDSNGTDDENGVVFPALVRGTTVTIPVVVTVYDYGSGLLNAWFDWNGNGSFESTEKVTGGTIYGDGSTPYQETVNLSVTVPASAVIGPTFARFRFGGGYSLPTGGGSTTYGEVEDYRIIIGEPTAVTLADFRATSVPGQGALLTWKTLLEVDTLGFHLDRALSADTWVRITPAIIPAQGQAGRSQQYRFDDAKVAATSGVQYRLMEVDVRGQEQVLAVATLTPGLTPLAIERTADGLKLVFEGTPGTSAVIETTANMALGPWVAVDTIVIDAAGRGVLIVDRPAAESAAFYRARVSDRPSQSPESEARTQ